MSDQPVRLPGDASGPTASERLSLDDDSLSVDDLVAIGEMLWNLAEGLGPYGELGEEDDLLLVCRECRAPMGCIEEQGGGGPYEEFYSHCTACGASRWNDTLLTEDVQEDECSLS